MKQTILSKCFSKVKRVALALFAALCVGNVWGTYITVDVTDLTFSDAGALTFNYRLGYWDSTTDRYAYLLAEVFDSNDVAIKSQEIVTKAAKDKLVENGYDSESPLPAQMDGIAELTGCDTLEALYENGYALKITFRSFQNKKNFDYGAYKVFCKESGVTRSEVSFNTTVSNGQVIPIAYTVSGAYDKEKGIEKIEIHYVLNQDSLENAEIVEATLNEEEGTYTCNILCESLQDVLRWSVFSSINGDMAAYRNMASGLKVMTGNMQEGNVAYTWTGDVDNNWGVVGNWSYTGPSVYGYPGKKDGSYYVTKAIFDKDAEVDLGGNAYYLWDNNRGFSMYENITLKLKNGTLGFQPQDDGSAITLNFGARNSTLILKDVAMPYTSSETTTAYKLKPVEGSTIIIDGDEEYYWQFQPGNKNTKFCVKNGTVLTSYSSADPKDGSNAEISNGVWVVKNKCTKGLVKGRTVFRDGPDRQARLLFRSSSARTYYAMKLVGTYDFKVNDEPYLEPYVLASNLTENATCTINIDVSDNSEALRIPLIKFTGDLDNNTKNAMKTMTTTASKLVVKANNVNVKAARNAKLVWDLSAKTLYYQQDSENAALVDGVEYATLGDAFAAVQAGGTVKLLRDNLEIAEMLSITKDFTIDLNGRTLKETVTPAEGEDRGAIYVGVGKTLTVTDSLSFGKITSNGDIVIGNYGTVIVNNGTIEAGADDENDVSIYNFYYSGSIYGKATVNGGSIGRIWNCGTLNITAGTVADVDNSGAMTIDAGATVTKILLKNGSDAAEVPGAGTITAPEGLEIESDVEGYKAAYENGVYTLVVDTVTVAPGGAAAVVDTEAAADAVEIAVEVPDGVAISLDAYKAYFTKSVTQNSEGKYEVTAVLNPNEVTPEIAATTEGGEAFVINADGNVTLNINNKKPGLYYGVQVLAELGADPVVTVSETADGLVVPAEKIPEGNAAFFRVVVDFKPFGETEAE